MEKLTTAQRLQVCRILDRHLHHNVSISSSLYKELQEILKILTGAPTT